MTGQGVPPVETPSVIAEEAPLARVGAGNTIGRLVRTYLAFFLLAGLLAIAAALSPTSVALQTFITLAYGSSVLGIVALGQTMLLITGDFDMSVAGVMGAAGIAALLVLPMGVVPAVFAALLVGVLVGLINGMIVLRTNSAPFLVTLGMQLLLYGLGLTITQSRTLYGKSPEFDWIGQGFVFGIPVTLLLFLVLALVLQVVLLWTRFGRYLYAIGNNREAARLSGVPVARIRLLAFVLCGTTAALGGLTMASRLNSITANAGLNFDFLSIIAVVLGGTSLFGGRGGTLRTVVGVLVLGTLDHVLILLGADFSYSAIVRGVVFLIVVAFDRLSRSAQ
jgi:ribose/xylose/arabinose/galactoside ABC-type transport system permease subunit